MQKSYNLVLVTGASGFVGSHCIKQLLEAGYKVRGTVRSLKNQKKNEFLWTLAGQFSSNLELVEADLTNNSSWDKAVQGCDAILHVASPITLKRMKESEFIIPAVQGTLNVLENAVKHQVKKVVFCSTMLAIIQGNFKNKPLTEEDWSDEKYCSSYAKSKLRAERAAWDFYQKNKDKFEMAVVNPGFIIGPIFVAQGGMSEEAVRDVISGKMPRLPRITSQVVDVRDVASMLIKAMESEKSNGKRYICAAQTIWMRDMGAMLHAEFSPLGYKTATKEVPDFLLKMVGCCVKDARMLVPALGKFINADDSRAKNEFGFEYRSVKKSLAEMGYSLIDKGVLPDKRKK